MGLLEIMERFPHEQSCVSILERIQLSNNPCCPHRDGLKVAMKVEQRNVGRWNCHDCNSTFTVFHGTVYQGSKLYYHRTACKTKRH